MMMLLDRPIASVFKTAIAACAGISFLVASIVVALEARHYQISGQPMPNGKGGSMTPGNGYLITAVLLLFSVAVFLQARRFWRENQDD
jgi:hypothetical protein